MTRATQDRSLAGTARAASPAAPTPGRTRRHAAPTGPLTWQHDPRIRAVVAAAAALGYVFTPHGLAGVAAPVQLWRAVSDEVLAQPWHAEQVRRLLPEAPEYHEVAGAGHYAFLAPCPSAIAEAVPEISIDAPGFDRTAFHTVLNEAAVRFFREHLPPG